MRDEKLARALIFLSLDCITEFSNELRIAPTLSAWRLDGLRGQIREYLQLKQCGWTYSAICSQVYHALNPKDSALWRNVWNWANSVFNQGGSDRKSECFWSLVLAEHWSNGPAGSELPNGLGMRLISIQDRILEAKKRAEKRYDLRNLEPLSEWDSLALQQIHIEAGFLGDYLAVTTHYNRLVTEWRSEGFDVPELLQIFEWGKARAAKFGIREVEVPFPGSWEYGLFFEMP